MRALEYNQLRAVVENDEARYVPSRAVGVHFVLQVSCNYLSLRCRTGRSTVDTKAWSTARAARSKGKTRDWGTYLRAASHSKVGT